MPLYENPPLIDPVSTPTAHSPDRYPLVEAANKILELNLSPINGRPYRDFPDISQDRIDEWSRSLDSLGVYKSLAIYLISYYEYQERTPFEGQVLCTLLHLEESSQDSTPEQLLSENHGIRSIATKLAELGLELHFRTTQIFPYIAYTVLPPDIPFLCDRQKGKVEPIL
jgi:hypothetical protein